MLRSFAVVACLFCAVPAVAAPAYYRFDPVHSQILVSASHNGFSNPVGRLQIAGGWLRFDAEDWQQSAVEVDIDLTSINLGEEAWNAGVRDADYLAVATNPLAHYSGSDVERTGPNRGIVRGTLTLRGVTHPLDITFTLNRNEMTIFGMHKVAGFSGTATFDRFDYGMTANDNSVGHEVSVRLEIEAIRDPDAGRNYHQTQTQAGSHEP